MGLCYYDIALIFSFEKIYSEEMKISFFCEVIKEAEEKDYYNKYIVKVIKNDELKNSKNTKLILYVKKDKNLFPGDVIIVTGSFEKGALSRNYKGFNYRRYLKQNKIYGIVFSDNLEIVSKRKDMYYMFGKIRVTLEIKIDNLYEEEYSNFLKGLLIGNKSELDENIIEDFQNASISHILAISGLHISFIIVGINFVLEKIINSKKIRSCLLIFFLIFFLILTGNSVSCMRTCIMNIFVIMSFLFHRKNSLYRSICMSFIFIIIINPYNIFSVGLWLSYGGTIGIILISNFFNRLLLKKLKNINSIQFILNNFSLCISSQIFIFPVMIYVFNTFFLTFLISNIIVSSFIGFILAFGYITIIVSFVCFPISKLIAYFETCMIFIILKTANVISELPFSKIYIPTPSILLIIIYYLLWTGFIIYFKYNNYKVLKFLCNIKYKKTMPIKHILKFCIKNKYAKGIIVFVLITALIVNLGKFNLDLKVHFIDVGQGDCTLIITPLGKRIIVDGGEGNSDKYDYGKKVLFPYLLDRGINRIDYLVVSHADSDHIGGLIYVLENMKVNNIFIGTQPKSSNQLEALIKIANKKKIKITILEKGDIKKIEKDIKLEVLWPDKNNLISENTLNNNSLVFKLKYNNFSIFFAGDIEEIAEKEIIKVYREDLQKINTTVLKVPHHGSKTSSTKEFLEVVSPKVCLIGVGKNNNFGHPSNEVIDRIENMGIKIYRTDKMGEIAITVNRKGKFSVKKYIK